MILFIGTPSTDIVTPSGVMSHSLGAAAIGSFAWAILLSYVINLFVF